MKKILIPLLVLTVITAACLPVAAPVDSVPQVDTQATIDSIVNTAVALTQTAQPTSTTVLSTETNVTDVSTATEVSDASTSTPAPNLTTTPATATSGAVDNTAITPTATLASTSGVITLTPTLGVLTYGTLPPAVPSSQVTLVNKSRVQAYISLQLYNTAAQGAILEYPVHGTVKIRAPIGNYVYVVWVGGRQLVGTLKIIRGEDLIIMIYKDKITIQ